MLSPYKKDFAGNESEEIQVRNDPKEPAYMAEHLPFSVTLSQTLS